MAFDNLNENKSSNYKYCTYCGAPIHRKSEDSYCPECRDRILFHNVRDYIRTNDVNEFQVAAHFSIPLRTVKSWIKEGRIEYKETPNGMRSINNHLRCEHCGAPVTFGTICPKCLKTMNKNIHGYDLHRPEKTEDRMRFLNNKNE